MTHCAHRSHQQGFGMIVVALLFTAFAVTMATMLDRNTVEAELGRQQQQQEQLARLNTALVQYARFNGDRFPCPASYLEVPSSGTFGAATTATCSGVGAAPTGTYLASGSSNKLIVGMVPVKELVPYGISYNDAFDAWGSRIMYGVHRDLTTGGPGTAVDGERAAVVDYLNQQAITPNPDVILFSFGRDRVGGRLRNQASLTNPSIACGVTQRRYLNCDEDRSFIRGPLFTSSGAAPTAYFDDTVSVVRYF